MQRLPVQGELPRDVPAVSLNVYGKPGCSVCTVACKTLDASGIAYEYRDTAADETAYNRVVELGYQTLPVFEDGDRHFPFGGEFQDLVKTRRVA